MRISYQTSLRLAFSVSLRYSSCIHQFKTSLRKTPMTIVTLSSRFQVVIPKDVREHLDLKPGQKLQALSYKGRVELIPIEAIEAARGFLRG